MLHPIPTAVDAERIQFHTELNDHLYDLRQHRMYFENEEGSFVIHYYNNKVIYAAYLDKETNTPYEEVIFFKEQWYHVTQDSRLRIKIDSEEAINFVEWIYVETGLQNR